MGIGFGGFGAGGGGGGAASGSNYYADDDIAATSTDITANSIELPFEANVIAVYGFNQSMVFAFDDPSEEQNKEITLGSTEQPFSMVVETDQVWYAKDIGSNDTLFNIIAIT